MRLLPVLGAAVALLAGIGGARLLAAAEMTSVIIVDDPRPVAKWGFAPVTRRIQPDTWVTWSNDGYDAHSVTAVDGLFDSGDLGPSEGFSFYFSEPGTFAYVCSLHPWMTGRIVVGEPSAVSDQPSAVSDQQSVDDGSSTTEERPVEDELISPG